MKDFILAALSSKAGNPSSTRLFLLAIVVTLLALVWAILFQFLRTGVIADIPIGTGAFLAGLLTVIATLKGWQDQKETDIEKKE